MRRQSETVIDKVKVCPRCGLRCDYTSEAISDLFGWRMVAGKEIPQSYCVKCRGIKKPVSDLVSFDDVPSKIISLDLASTRKQYISEFPGDKTGDKRAWRFMVSKLLKRKFELDCAATQKYYTTLGEN